MLLRLAHRGLIACLITGGMFACEETRSTLRIVQRDTTPDASVPLAPAEPASQEVDAGAPELDAGDEPPPASDAGEMPPAPTGPPYPIVLMHGMGGFNELENLPFTVSYFNGVQADLQAHGEAQVFFTIAPPYDTSENRAAAIAPQLQTILQQTGAAKLNLIAHSQGGLDARILASPQGLDMNSVIASITTVSTPHRGSPVADLALGLTSGIPSFIAGPVGDAFLQLLEDGVYPVQSNPNILGQATELTTAYATSTFNPSYPDATGVVYESYAGRTNLESGAGDCDDGRIPNNPNALDLPQAFFIPTAGYMQLIGVQNDGLVPISSAKWGTFMGCVPADHLKEVGLLFQNGPDPISGFDHLQFFRDVVARLRAQGL